MSLLSLSLIYLNTWPFLQGSKENMEDHLDENLEEHLQLACDVIQEQRTEMELMRERLRKQNDAMCQLTESVAKLKALVEDHITVKDTQEKAVYRLSEQAKEQKKHQGKFEKETKYKIAELQNKFDGAKGTDQPSMRSELMRHPGLNGYGEQVWRIMNVTRRLQRIQSRRGDDPTTSEPFYSSAFGYKMSAWIYINGRGKEEGRCMSLYACVTCGEYDPILKWPIKPKYTFMLLDQSPDVENRKDLVRTRRVNDFKRDDVRQKGIERPLPTERAIIVGFDDFISHEELEMSPRYLVNDTIFIRVLADIQDEA